jgi:4-hydroxy-tetrahydrodipicolinate reductase
MPSAAPTPPLIRAVLIGVTGRMGQALLRAAPAFSQLIITGAIASPQSLALGRDAGELAGIAPLNLPVSADLLAALAQADVVLDFSTPQATAANLAACRAARKPLLIGTTGFGTQLGAQFEEAARGIALLIAPNTSLAVALLTELTAQAVRALPGFDIDIVELHHRGKRDAPSGTALALAQAARSAGAGEEAQIGMASLRAGDIVGEHTVILTGHGEQLSLAHRALDRSIFARGALTAALWLASAAPGRYLMRDFLVSKTGG